ncbi:hypothetical protein PF010_g12760 [Phytophthora fragariae]|uniref:Secreted protein n=1 Tax=Phytophthora fragariae TaxID=53985 RepID=A0A6A3KLG6_9STRA|nr:hypothetical protein PF011_g11467 [Phytophthora fragariae]KAE9106060.1 hypothetical protein PF010_g12760 [Phytophthora fragariae]KAE9227064.1 hypothetical protein PF004_g11464 [Phytophthora fragariae]
MIGASSMVLPFVAWSWCASSWGHTPPQHMGSLIPEHPALSQLCQSITTQAEWVGARLISPLGSPGRTDWSSWRPGYPPLLDTKDSPARKASATHRGLQPRAPSAQQLTGPKETGGGKPTRVRGLLVTSFQ